MKAISQLFSIIMMLAHISVTSQYAYGHYDDKHFSHFDFSPLDAPPDVEQSAEVIGILKSPLQTAPLDNLDVPQDRLQGGLRPPSLPSRLSVTHLIARNGTVAPRPVEVPEPGADEGPIEGVPQSVPGAPTGEGPIEGVPAIQAPVVVPGRIGQEQETGTDWKRAPNSTAQAIIKIARYTESASTSDILKTLGYSQHTIEWLTFPAESQLEIAYRIAENTASGDGDKLLVRVVHELAKSYESITHDEVVKELLNKSAANQYYQSPDLAAVIQTIHDPSVPTDTINTIARYCCGALGGMRNLLIEHLSLEPAVAEQILISSSSNIEALIIGLFFLPPAKATAQIKSIIKVLQEHYDTARDDEVFNNAIIILTRYGQSDRPHETAMGLYFMLRDALCR